MKLLGAGASLDENPGGNVLEIAFILLKKGPFFSFVFGTTRHSCLLNSIPTPFYEFIFFLCVLHPPSSPYGSVVTVCTVVCSAPSEEMEMLQQVND